MTSPGCPPRRRPNRPPIWTNPPCRPSTDFDRAADGQTDRDQDPAYYRDAGPRPERGDDLAPPDRDEGAPSYDDESPRRRYYEDEGRPPHYEDEGPPDRRYEDADPSRYRDDVGPPFREPPDDDR